MMRQQLDAEFLAGPGEGLPCLANAENLAARINACSAVNGDAGGTQAVRGEPFEQAAAALNLVKISASFAASGRFGFRGVF